MAKKWSPPIEKPLTGVKPTTPDPTREQAAQLLDGLIAWAKADAGYVSAIRESILTLDRYMRHGYRLPPRWTKNRRKCGALIGDVPLAVCVAELGHPGEHEPRTIE